MFFLKIEQPVGDVWLTLTLVIYKILAGICEAYIMSPCHAFTSSYYIVDDMWNILAFVFSCILCCVSVTIKYFPRDGNIHKNSYYFYWMNMQ